MPATSRFHLKRVLSLFIPLLLGLVVLSAPSGTAQAASATKPHALPSERSSSASRFTCGAWSVVASPNAGSFTNDLLGVAAVSAGDAWAVGYYVNSAGLFRTLTMHWRGKSWSVVPSPNPNLGENLDILTGVAAVSAGDVWAVGYSTNYSTGITRTLTLHWKGTSWSLVDSPNAGSFNQLLGVAAVSASDVWAVGDSTNSTGSSQNLTLHWNGTSWSVVPSPNPSSFNQLYGVAAVSASDVWAVGEYFDGSIAADQTLTEQWNGTSWSVVASPNNGSGYNLLFGVAAVSTSDVWAVGEYVNNNRSEQTLTLHWNGTSWSLVSSPNVGYNQLFGVAAVSTSDVWAVGDSLSTAYRTLTIQWNGTSWSVVTSPNVGSNNNQLFGVAASTRGVWAVGYYSSSGTGRTLIEFYC